MYAYAALAQSRAKDEADRRNAADRPGWGPVDGKHRRVDSLVAYHLPGVFLGDVVFEPVRLSVLPRRLLRQFLDRRIVSVEDAIEALWCDDPEGGPLYAEECVRRYVMDLRRVLRPSWRIVAYAGGVATYRLIPT